MKKYRILSLFLTALMSISASGCSGSDRPLSDRWLGQDSSEEASDSENKKDKKASDNDAETIDLDTIRNHVLMTLEDAEKPGNAEKLSEDIDTLLNDLDTVSQALTNITIDYYSDWYDEELEAEYDSCYETFYVSYELLGYAFHNCYKIEEYSELFAPYIESDYLEYYTDSYMSLNRLEGYAKVDYAVMDENLDKYYDIANDTKLNDEKKNLEAAEVYLDILSIYDTETFYDTFNRDFSPEEAIKLRECIISELVPAAEKLGNAFYDLPDSDDVYDDPVLYDDMFEVILQCAKEISPEITESAERIIEDELYFINEGDDCYNGSFTTDLPLDNSSVVYLYTADDYYDLVTAIHEFGHFHASFYDETPTYLMANNIDIAEIQSQGMEMIFMEHYDEIYGEQADEMRLLKLYDMLDSVTSGFAVGEFEYTVLKNYDTMTPELVVECFDSIMDKYGYDIDFYYISHIFEQPGYYISYGVSALAALNIWDVSTSDYDNAVELYSNIAEIPINSSESQFKSALKQCGFSDVLNEEYIKALADKLSVYAESFNTP